MTTTCVVTGHQSLLEVEVSEETNNIYDLVGLPGLHSLFKVAMKRLFSGVFICLEAL